MAAPTTDQPQHPASSDSDEQASIASAERDASTRDPATGATVTVLDGSHDGDDKRQKTNGHLDPKRRRIYLIVFSVAIISAMIGYILILTWMLRFRDPMGFGFTDSKQLANLHVILMFTFMVSINMYAILVYRTHYYLPKKVLKWAHAILSGGNMVFSLLGVLAMYKSHVLAKIPNFYSLHSWIGVTTNVFYLLQFSAGFVAFLKPGLSLSIRTSLMPWHRKIGATILVLAALAAITGMAELVIFQDGPDHPYSKFEAITFVANFAGLSVIVMTIATIYLVTATQYLRPELAEEWPLRR